MYQTLLWDVDATLLNFEKSEAVSLKELFGQYGIVMDDQKMALYKKINRHYWDGLEEGLYDRHTVLTKRYDDFFDALRLPRQDHDVMNDFYQEALGRNFFIEEGATETLKALQGKVRQYVVSNGSYIAQINKMHNAGLDPYIDGMFISEKMGVEKPDPHFFEIVKAETGYDEKTTMIIGDSLTSDIKGGNNAHITTVWFNPKHLVNNRGVHCDYEIDHLRDVIKLI